MSEFQPLSRARLKALKTLRRGKGRRRARMFFVEGVRLVGEAMAEPGWVQLLVVTPERAEDERGARLVEQARRMNVETLLVRDSDMAALSDTVTHQGAYAMCRDKRGGFREAVGAGRPILSLAGVGDPGNAGALIRAACAFGFASVVPGENTVDVVSPKVLRASMGGWFQVDVTMPAPWDELREATCGAGYRVLRAATRGGADAWTYPYTRKTLLAITGEQGVESSVLGDATPISIPMPGSMESLNTAMAGGILMACASRAISGEASAAPS